jgi:hypothetical protein
MRREWLLSVGAVALAFLGSQHHNLMMVLFALGLGSAEMNLMTEMPLVRFAMLALSLLMVAGIAYQISRPGRPLAMRLTVSLSILLTLAIVGWSVLRFGL